MKLKFNMLVLMIDDDYHGYEKKPVFTLSGKKYPDIQTAEKRAWFSDRRKKKRRSRLKLPRKSDCC